MPASSKAQQRFFGVVKSMQKGDKPKKGEAGKIAKQMSKKDVDKYASTKHKGKPEKVKREMKVRELIKKMVREELANLDEAAKRDYKAEYKKFQSSTKSKKYRAELNKYNRQKGTYGNGDGKDASHKGGKIVGFEKESVNRGRAEKSRLKKEGKLNEFNKSHFLNLIKQEIDSLKGQIAYSQDALRQKDIEDWEKKEFKGVLKDLLKKLKVSQAHYKRVQKLKEGTCGYGETGELGEEPAGPHLIKKKKMKEEVEPIGGMAKIAKIVKDKQHAKVGGQTVDMQSANLLMKLYNAVKDKDKEKMNKMNEKKLIMVLNKLWSRVKLKLPV